MTPQQIFSTYGEMFILFIVFFIYALRMKFPPQIIIGSLAILLAPTCEILQNGHLYYYKTVISRLIRHQGSDFLAPIAFCIPAYGVRYVFYAVQGISPSRRVHIFGSVIILGLCTILFLRPEVMAGDIPDVIAVSSGAVVAGVLTLTARLEPIPIVMPPKIAHFFARLDSLVG